MSGWKLVASTIDLGSLEKTDTGHYRATAGNFASPHYAHERDVLSWLHEKGLEVRGSKIVKIDGGKS